MKCPNCHKELPNEAKFCLHCGAKLEVDNSTIECPRCHHQIPSDSKFCPDCGEKIEKIFSDNDLKCLPSDTSVESALYNNTNKTIHTAYGIDDNEYSLSLNIQGTELGEYYKNYSYLDWAINENGCHKAIVDNIEINTDEYGTIVSYYSKSVPKELIHLIGCANGWLLQDWMSFFDKKRYEIKSHFDNNYFEIEITGFDIILCLQFRNDNTLRYLSIEQYRDKSFYWSIFPLNGVVIGKTRMKTLEKAKNKVINREGTLSCNINGCIFMQTDHYISHIKFERDSELPFALKQLGITWDCSYNDIIDILVSSFHYIDKSSPKVVSKKGRNMLVAKVSCAIDYMLSIDFDFDNGNEHGEGYHTDSLRTLNSINLLT